ncbi:hypothetical protein M011DRAFT_494819 [Sporormia fimetaria CBS 119925]|uniref:Uncharacterized protein n=1 Tax=Sporormia fimetaria CBS 119925 TaxID=1340428 RepID=A0A6A6VA79_9PLEO|nr:hypothetical protein M011DRAFT_494819 [Sporormia fimetaria CBS 119925]
MSHHDPNLKNIDPSKLKATDFSPDDLKASADAAEKALKAQGLANKLYKAAATVTDPAKREKFIRDAYDKEVEAHGASKKARMLTSGAFQGGVGGAGIGTAVGAGLGTVVGTVVGTVASIPTTGIGALAGMGVGAAHGPWIKLPPIGKGKDGGGEKDEGGEDGKEEELDIEGDDSVVPDPNALRQAAEALDHAQAKPKSGEKGEKPKEKKKPRKLEVRSNKSTKKE